MPAGQGKDAEERFAAAVESETSFDPMDDAELARELAIVAMLRSRGNEFAPDEATKARAKARFMAVLAEGATQEHADLASAVGAVERTAPMGRLAGSDGTAKHAKPDADETDVISPVEDANENETTQVVTAVSEVAGEEDPAPGSSTVSEPHKPARKVGRRARHSVANRPAGRARAAGGPAAGLRRRAVLVGAGAMAVLLALTSGGIFASQDSLPGEGLYAVKRASESASLAFTFNDEDRARRQLEIAATRLTEVEKLAALDAEDAPQPEVFSQALTEFGAATDEGSRLMLESTEQGGADGTTDADLRTWATTQSERLTDVAPTLPAGANTDDTLALLDRIIGRDAGTDEDCSGEDCAESTGPNSTSKPGSSATGTPDSGTTGGDSDPTGEPSDSTTPSEGDDPRLLPDLLPETSDSTKTTTQGKEKGSSATSTPGSTGGTSEPGLLPPVTLPPLLPGLPGITIG